MAVLCSAGVPWLAKIVGFMPTAVARAAVACAISVQAASALTPGMIMIFFPARPVVGTLPPYCDAYVLKLGRAAAVFTSPASAEMLTFDEFPEFEEELLPPDEQPAARTSPATATTGITLL